MVDHDGRSNEYFDSIVQWSKSKSNYSFSMSNPKFEYWLLLHFEDGKNLKSADDCTNRLAEILGVKEKRKIKTLDGNLVEKFTLKNMNDAIERAKTRPARLPSSSFPAFGSTTVYLLAEFIGK